MKGKLNKILKTIPLKTRIKVANEMAFIDLIVKLGYREEKMWDESEDELLSKLCSLAEEHTSSILKEIDGWTKDGKPS